MFTLSFVILVWVITIPLSRLFPAVLDYSLTIFRIWPYFFIGLNLWIKSSISKIGYSPRRHVNNNQMITGPCIVLIGVLGTKIFTNFDKLIIPYGIVIIVLLCILWFTFIYKIKQEEQSFIKALPSFCWDEIRGVIWLLILLPLSLVLTILQYLLMLVNIVLFPVLALLKLIFHFKNIGPYIVHFKDTFLRLVFTYSKDDSV